MKFITNRPVLNLLYNKMIEFQQIKSFDQENFHEFQEATISKFKEDVEAKREPLVQKNFDLDEV